MNAGDWSLRIAELARREHCALVDLLLALAEFDRLGVYRQLGFPSLFDRQVAARFLQAFPEIAEPLRDGRLCVSSVPRLAKVMTEENRAEVMPRRTVVTVSQLLAPVDPAPVFVLPVGRDRTHPEGARPLSRRWRPGCTSRCHRHSWPC
jgi:hypothetical protein